MTGKGKNDFYDSAVTVLAVIAIVVLIMFSSEYDSFIATKQKWFGP
jgi:hypothetical protein